LRAPRLFSTRRRRNSSTESSSGALRLAIAKGLYRKAWGWNVLCKRGEFQMVLITLDVVIDF
jgi:hypothetical protein